MENKIDQRIPIRISELANMPEAANMQTIYPSTRCPHCGQKLWDKQGICSGMVSVKCSRCKKTVLVDLALRGMKCPTVNIG